ncbi:MAG: hypothetical protein VKS61_12485 [Candidatus Sericytochromatia bacterium]|nr:hypothetical protein [Candidatus Sericytochromatia bacterium]
MGLAATLRAQAHRVLLAGVAGARRLALLTRQGLHADALQRGQVALAELHPAEALAAFEEARRLRESPEACDGLAACQVALRLEAFLEAALRQADAALARERPALARAILAPAVAAYPREDGHRMLAEIEARLRARAAWQAGLAAAAEGCWGLAEQAFGASLEALGDNHPAGPTARLYQASMALQRGAPQQALAYLEGHPEPEAARLLGHALVALGLFREAAAAFKASSAEDLAAQAGEHADHQRWLALGAIEDAVARQAWDEAEQVARAQLADAPHALVQRALTHTIKPGKARHAWSSGTTEARLQWAFQALQQALSPGTLHNWFVALDEGVAGDTRMVEAWLAAAAAVEANLDAVLGLLQKHRDWSKGDRDALPLQLRGRVQQRLDAAVAGAPHSAAAWLAAWRVEVAAIDLATAGRALPTRDGMNLTPGLWRLLGARESEAPDPSSQPFRARCLAALYSDWAEPVGAWLVGDGEAVRLGMGGPATGHPAPSRHRELLDGLQAIELALLELPQGAASAWRRLRPAVPLLRTAKRVCRALDQAAQDAVDAGAVLAPRAFAAGWREVLNSPRARDAWVTVEVTGLAADLHHGALPPSVVHQRLQDLWPMAPTNRAALRLAHDLQPWLQPRRNVTPDSPPGRPAR